MIQFFFSKYTLQPSSEIGSLASNKPREGALFKIQWPDGKTGFADFFPWPELGDGSLEENLALIRKGKMSPLFEQTIWLARKDAIGRSEKRNLLKGLPRIKNHYLVNEPLKLTEELIQEAKGLGFTTFKFKIGRSPEDEVKFLDKFFKFHPQISIRLDLNSSMTFESFGDLVNAMSIPLRGRIEYVEDPFPYSYEAWSQAQEWLPLALDHEYHRVDWDKIKKPLPFKTLIIKPARQDVKKCLDVVNKFALKMVMTSSLDHPLGVAFSALVAAETKKFYPNVLLDCGCLSIKAYQPNEFAASILLRGPYIFEIPGLGIGFDSILEKTVWTPLRG